MRAAGRGHAKDAVALLEQSLARFREVDERRGIAIVLLDLAAAFASLERDEHRRRAALLEGLALLSELGDREGIARALDALASLSADQRRWERAVRLAGAAESVRQSIGAAEPRPGAAAGPGTERRGRAGRCQTGPGKAALRARVGSRTCNVAARRRFLCGSETSGANASGPAAPTTPAETPRFRLTTRELEVLGLLAAGHSNAEIARILVLSVKTVERHIANLYAKIGAHCRVDATAYAFRQGLL